jgi:hypothetical protein
MEEEHSGEDGLLEEVKTDKGKISRGNVQKRIKEIKNDIDADAAEELKVLNAYLELMEIEVGANKKIKDAQKAQDEKVIDRYKSLTEDEVKTMVVGRSQKTKSKPWWWAINGWLLLVGTSIPKWNVSHSGLHSALRNWRNVMIRQCLR